MADPMARLELFPVTTRVAGDPPRLFIDGVDVAELARHHGTPLYLYDQATLDQAVDAYQEALARHYPGPSIVVYAGKAFLCRALVRWAVARGLGIDCTGAGEIQIAVAGGAPRARILVHGVNKTPADLDAALAHAAVLVVDHLGELERLGAGWLQGASEPELWLRVRPGLAVDTHAYRQTGQEESKFGMGPAELERAVRLCLDRGLPLTGIHFHQGSQFRDPTPLGAGLDRVLEMVARLRDLTGWTPRHLSPGGGWGVAYHEGELPHPPVEPYVAFVAQRLVAGCAARGLPLPTLHLEPGRSLVARAGVAVYQVGAVKRTGPRRWLLVDGGMADNIRPALYGARYSCLPVVEPARPALGPAWVAGPYCESGDVLISGLPMADVAPGEWIAVPVSGAYHLAMASNYNGARRPPVLWLAEGRARTVLRRETPADLLARDVG